MNARPLSLILQGLRVGLTALCFIAGPGALAQTNIPGTSYFGRSNYIEYIAGNLPVILSEPHGGALNPSEIPDRTYGTFTTDSNTEALIRNVQQEIAKLTGHFPHIVICRLDRQKIDCNREIVEGAQGDPEAEQAWNEFQNYIINAKSNITTQFSKGFYIDLHGHGHTIQRLELGYLLDSSELANSDATLNSTTYENQSSIRTLSQQSPLTFPALLRGTNSFGAMLEDEGYPSVPSDVTPNPGTNAYFNGGYNTVEHSSVNGGVISGLQIESNYDGVRDTAANRTNYARALARVIDKYFLTHYGTDLRVVVPSVWTNGSGNWATAANWLGAAVPVSTNHLLFSGSGGTATHNLTALATGTGFISSLNFSNATGSYTLTGNAITLLGGITNKSIFAQTISNIVSFNSIQTIAANSNSFTFGGTITNNGSQLRFTGESNITVNAVITGNGAISKSGNGTLVLGGTNTYHGDTSVSAGTLQVSATSTFGDGSGTLNCLGGTIVLSATRDTTNGVLSNPITLFGDIVVQNTPGAGSGTRNFPFGANSIQTPGGSVTIKNVAVANVNTMNLRFQGSGFDFSRSIVFDNSGAADTNNNSVQLDCYNTNGVQTFSGVISGNGKVRRGAQIGPGATTVLTGANTYSGGTTINDGTLLVNNSSGSGTGTGSVTVNSPGILGGSGTIAGAVSCGGTISPGASPGLLTLQGGLNLSTGGTYIWELASNTTSNAGANFDQLLMTGGNLVLGGSSKLQIQFTGSATAPTTSNSFWQFAHGWRVITLTNSAINTGNTIFGSISNASFAAGVFSVTADSSGVLLNWIPSYVPPQPVLSSELTGTWSSNVIVSWSSVSGVIYQLQYKTNLNQTGWLTAGDVMATTTNVSLADTNGPGFERYYRVIIP